MRISIFLMTPFGGFLFSFIVLLLLLFILRLIVFFFERLILKKSIITHKRKRVIYLTGVALAILAAATITYIDHNPFDEFYFNEWGKHTNIELPESINIKDKQFGYPDFSGDYATVAIFTLSKSDYILLKQKVLCDSLFKSNKERVINFSEFDNFYTRNDITGKRLKTTFQKETHYGECLIGFIDKGNLIYFGSFSY